MNLMKTIFSIFLLVSTHSILLSQSFPDPEFSDRPYVLAEDKLTSLERADAQYEAKTKAMGYGGVNSYYTLFSPKSDTRFKKESLPKLIIKVEGNIDPAEKIILVKAEIKSERRRFLVSGMALGGKSKDVGHVIVKLEFKKVRDLIYEIILPSDILPGEYGFMPIASSQASAFSASTLKQKLSCFGID